MKEALCLVAIFAFASPAAARTLVSLTFDDGTADHLLGARMLEERGFKGTFYVNSARIGASGLYLTLSDLRAISAAGHEIAGHTLHHLNVARLSEAERRREICEDRSQLRSWGFDAVSFAYPFGASSEAAEATVRECGYSSARVVGSLACPSCPKAETVPPENPYVVRTPRSARPDTTLGELQRLVLDAEQAGGGWVPLVLHRLCESCDPFALSTGTLAGFLDWLKEREPRGTLVRTVAQVIAGEAAPPPEVVLSTQPPTTPPMPTHEYCADGIGEGCRPLRSSETASVPAVEPPLASEGPGKSVPLLTFLEPRSVAAGGPEFVLTVFGQGFSTDSRVEFNGEPRPTHFASSSTIRAGIPASDIVSSGTARVSVFDPSGRSNILSFAIAPSPHPHPSLAADLGGARVFPNPWRADTHAGIALTVDQLTPGSEVRIYTMSGRWVRTISAPAGVGHWDLTDDAGQRVASGIYLYLISDTQGRRRSGSFAVVR